MIDQTFRILTVGAGANKIGFLQPKVRDLVLMRQAEMTIHVPQKPRARKRVRSRSL